MATKNSAAESGSWNADGKKKPYDLKKTPLCPFAKSEENHKRRRIKKNGHLKNTFSPTVADGAQPLNFLGAVSENLPINRRVPLKKAENLAPPTIGQKFESYILNFE